MTPPTSTPSGSASAIARANPAASVGERGDRAALAYITSPSFSGSTLLTFLLGAHPKVATIGELKGQALGNLAEYACSCGALILECPFWRRVGEAFARRGEAFDPAEFRTHFRRRGHPWSDRLLRARVRGPLLETVRSAALGLSPATRRFHRATIDRNRLFVDVLMELEQASLFADGSKDPVRLKFLHDAGHWDLFVIHLVRDGRGTANSYRKHYGMTVAEASWEWRKTHEECARLARRFPGERWMRVMYEDLCRRPRETLDEVFRFLGLDPREATRDYRAVEQHIIGNAMRLGASSEITLDEKWRAALTPGDLRTFEDIGGAMNRRFGYE